MTESYNIGNIYWAKLRSFPSWPSVVTKDKESGQFEKHIGNRHLVNVSFLGSNLSSWICTSNLTPFCCNDCGPNGQRENIPQSRQNDFDRAVAHANHILLRKATNSGSVACGNQNNVSVGPLVSDSSDSDSSDSDSSPSRPMKRLRVPDMFSEEVEAEAFAPNDQVIQRTEILPMPRIISRRQTTRPISQNDCNEGESEDQASFEDSDREGDEQDMSSNVASDEYNDDDEGNNDCGSLDHSEGNDIGMDANNDINVDRDENSDVENDTLCSAMVFDPNDFSQLNHFLCNFNTINDLVLKIATHSQTCCGKVIPFKQYILPKGHIGYTVFFLRFKCYTCEYTIEFCPSPILSETGRPISDYLVMHSKLTAGGLWENVERFCETLGFSSDFGDSFISDDFIVETYCDVVCDMAGESMQEAREKVIVEDNQLDGTFDASHLTRTNSPCSCVSMLSPDTCQVLYSATVSRTDEPISQNHEAVGTEAICREMKNDGYKMRAGSTDEGSRSASVLSNEFPETFLANLDPYHGLKNDTSKVQSCTKGTRPDHGKTWHHQLSEKCGPLMKHIRYSISESRISVDEYRDPIRRAEAAKVLQSRILIPLQHYQDRHDKCSPNSRCRLDPNYDLSRTKITDSVALKLLEKTLTSTTIFRNAHKYLLNMPTSMNESYHNRQNKYFSKRTCLSPRMYSLTIGISILDHNENEEGVFRNGTRIEPLPPNQDGLSKQPIQSRTFVYNIWRNYMLRRIV